MSYYKFLLVNQSTLKEHPQSAAAPDQYHTKIFPGDEIVLQHKLTFPDNIDDLANVMAKISFVSAKVAIIAEKKGLFSEQFSFHFTSTRSFDLDSFQTNFNNVNCPTILWSDGIYAPYMNLSLDRSWRLPPGDFRKKISFTTTHGHGTGKWNYNFFFPIIFRWEYWIAKLLVSNDFYAPSEPNHGHNEWWYHYLTTNWKFVSRLDLNLLYGNTPLYVRAEMPLTPFGLDDANDYNSNSDWTNKAIKTSVLGGPASNAPCLINKNEYTVVIGYFDKVSSWGVDEQTHISGVLWIEPTEGPGLNSRTRGSSTEVAKPETVFKGLDLSITDDSGTGITTPTGEYLVTAGGGMGAMVVFNGTQPEKVQIVGIIDHNKLNSIYPGVTSFTLYARLYNTDPLAETDPEKTVKGEEIKQVASLFSIGLNNTLCEHATPLCPFTLEVFADHDGLDPLKNDKTSWYEYGLPMIGTNVSLILQKQDEACGEFVDCIGFSDSAYGDFFPFGKAPDFSGDNFTDEEGKKYTGLQLEWFWVLDEQGPGVFRMKIEKTDSINPDPVITYDPRIFCLKEYHCNLVNRTVRIETVNEGLRGMLEDPTMQKDYYTGWYDQIRLKAVVKYKQSVYKNEYTQYGASDYNRKKPYINEQTPKYTLSIRPIPGWMDYYLSTNVLQADEILLTDYHQNNRHEHIRRPVINDGDYTPRDNNLLNQLSDVELSFAYANNNLRKRNSR